MSQAHAHGPAIVTTALPAAAPTRWAKVLDQTRCIGCHACTTACKSENQVPLSVTRTYVKYVDVGTFPQTRRAYQVTRCNQCEHAPCVAACPTAAMYRRPDGIVDFDKRACIGCKACIAACPYDAIFINPADHSAEKCNFCAHRLDVGLEPACVVVCPTGAIVVGNLHDHRSRLAQIVQREPVTVRRPEKDTHPLVFYKGAHQATLDPLAARRPDGGLFMWSQQRADGRHVVSGSSSQANSSAAALVSYDVAHTAPWDWRVSLYTWTKSVSAGVYMVAGALLLGGRIDAVGALWRWAVPVMAMVFLAITGGLLIADLEHPTRFYLLFTRPQWRSWLVRGAVIITAYAGLLVLHVAASVLQSPSAASPLAIVGLPLSAAVAGYTAYLFAQSKARDLWQSPLLPPHLLVQAIAAGAAALMPLAVWLDPSLVPALSWLLAGAAISHVVCVAGEISLAHATAHARQATAEMTAGRYRHAFWIGLFATAAACLVAPRFGPIAAPLALIGLMAHEHAYVQAGQAVPLA